MSKIVYGYIMPTSKSDQEKIMKEIKSDAAINEHLKLNMAKNAYSKVTELLQMLVEDAKNNDGEFSKENEIYIDVTVSDIVSAKLKDLINKRNYINGKVVDILLTEEDKNDIFNTLIVKDKNGEDALIDHMPEMKDLKTTLKIKENEIKNKDVIIYIKGGGIIIEKKDKKKNVEDIEILNIVKNKLSVLSKYMKFDAFILSKDKDSKIEDIFSSGKTKDYIIENKMEGFGQKFLIQLWDVIEKHVNDNKKKNTRKRKIN